MDKQKNHLRNRVLVYAIIWCLSYVGSIFAMKSLELPLEAGIALTIITVLAFATLIYKYYKSIYFMDEVHIKVQMEAVVIAFSLGLLLILTLGLLELFVKLNNEDWSYRHLVPYFFIFYFIGLFFSKRKYIIDNEKHD
jgi:NAD/NADP transhydrogenase beta subunit